MLGHMKKPHTEGLEISLLIKADSLDAVRAALAPYVLDSIHWRDIYADFHAGQALRGARLKEGMTQQQLSKKLNIPQRHISEMENGKRPIGKTIAKRFSEALNIDYRVML